MNLAWACRRHEKAQGRQVNPNWCSCAVKVHVTNLGSALMHEIILAEVNDENELLAYDIARNMVDEETIQTLAQVAEIAPSRSASFTLELKPGKYLLYCNYAGHYMAGMWTVIEVK